MSFKRNGSTWTNLIGYHDKLAWSIYADGRLSWVPFTPSFQSDEPKILDYCSKLRAWWLGTKVKKIEARRHLLIKDAHPDDVSSTYFDCTVLVSTGCYSHSVLSH